MVGGGRPLLPEILGQTIKLTPFPLQKMDTYDRYSLVAPQPLHLSKKVQLSLIGGPIRAFQWAQDEQRTLPQSPKGGSKTQIVSLPYKSGLVSKKVCYKVSLCENFQRQGCKAFTGLSICAQMVGGGYRFLPEILGQIDQLPWKMPTSNRCSLIAHIPLHEEKKVQLSLAGRPLRAF